MTSIWPTEDGWPYPDTGVEEIDFGAEQDDDLLALTVPSSHVFDGLDPLERRVITEHYGLGGCVPRSISELHDELGLSSSDVRHTLGSGLQKLRTQLQS